MKPSLEREQRLFDTLKQITRYQSADKLRKSSERQYGLAPDEAIEMAYENVLAEAAAAIKGLRRPTLQTIEQKASREALRTDSKNAVGGVEGEARDAAP